MSFSSNNFVEKCLILSFPVESHMKCTILEHNAQSKKFEKSINIKIQNTWGGAEYIELMLITLLEVFCNVRNLSILAMTIFHFSY